jgi:hypothetical protein
MSGTPSAPAPSPKRHVGSDHGAPNAPDAGGTALGGLTAPTTAVKVVHALRNELGWVLYF